MSSEKIQDETVKEEYHGEIGRNPTTGSLQDANVKPVLTWRSWLPAIAGKYFIKIVCININLSIELTACRFSIT